MFILGGAVIISKAAESRFRSGENKFRLCFPYLHWWLCLRLQLVGPEPLSGSFSYSAGLDCGGQQHYR